MAGGKRDSGKTGSALREFFFCQKRKIRIDFEGEIYPVRSCFEGTRHRLAIKTSTDNTRNFVENTGQKSDFSVRNFVGV